MEVVTAEALSRWAENLENTFASNISLRKKLTRTGGGMYKVYHNDKVVRTCHYASLAVERYNGITSK